MNSNVVPNLGWSIALWLALGCGENADSMDDASTDMGSGGSARNTSGGATGGGSANACETPGMLIAAEPNNYSFTSTLSLAPASVAPDSDLTFEWGGVTEDFLGHPLDPMADIDSMYLMLWSLTEQELRAKLNDDALRQSDLVVLAKLPTERSRTSGNLFEVLSAAGAELTKEELLPFVDALDHPPAEHTYTVTIASGDALSEGTRMIQAFKLDPASENRIVTLSNASTDLQHSVDLTSLEQTLVAPGESAISFDWSGMNMRANALGNEFAVTRIDRIAIARFAETPAELQTEFLSLVNYDGSINADEVYTAGIPAGASVELSALTNESGAPFAGIDATNTWMLALFCGACRNPAPWYLTFLSPCS